MKYSDYFELEELVPQNIFMQFAGKSRQFIDHRAGDLLDAIREMVGEPITINSWNSGGKYQDSGYRTPDCLTGGKLSQHKYGRGFDLKISLKGRIKSYEDFRNLIRGEFEELHRFGLSTIEKDTPTWLHIDMRDTGMDTLYEVPYK